MADGFILNESLDLRAGQVLPNAGGWSAVMDQFVTAHCPEMEKYPLRRMILLVDFDGNADRLSQVQEVIPAAMINRVFVIGVWTEPEDLRNDTRLSFEDTGKKLAQECRANVKTIWQHPLLLHNAAELDRMIPVIRPILFPQFSV